MNFHRKRKTKDPCRTCYLHRDLCLCELIPRLDLKTRVCLVVHAKELKRTTNTGRLALEALSNCDIKIRGADKDPLDLSPLLNPAYRSVLFFPSAEAVELTRDFVEQDPRPIQLIVPDGNWRQASKVNSRHPELSGLPRVMIKSENPSRFHLRAETTKEGMATLQAIARALGIIENPDVEFQLMNLYNEKLSRTLKARGVLKTLNDLKGQSGI